MSVISKNDNAFYESIVFSQEAGDTDWCKYKPVLSYKQPKLYIDSSNTTSTSLALFNQPVKAGQKITINDDTKIVNGIVGSITNYNPSYVLGTKYNFLVTQIGSNACAYMPNGNIFIAFIDTANSNFASIMILDKNGYVIQSKIAITTVSVSFIDCCTLSNGNVCIAYIETASQDGYSTVYSQTGSLINIKYRFATTATQDLKLVPFKYGKFAVTYTISTYANVKIFSNDNVYLNSGNLYISSSNITYSNEPTILQNGNVMIFGNEANTTIYYGIYNDIAGIVKSVSALVSTSCPSMSASTMDNGNVFFAYAKSTTNACFQILDHNGVVIKTETVFNTGATTQIKTIASPDGNVVIFFKTSDNYGKYLIYDNTGTLIKSLTTFESSNINVLSTCISPLGEVYLTYYTTSSIFTNINMSSKQSIDISSFGLSSIPTKAYKYAKPSSLVTSLMPTGKTRTSDISLDRQAISYSTTNIIVDDLYNRDLIESGESIKYTAGGVDKTVIPTSVVKTTKTSPIRSFSPYVVTKSKNPVPNNYKLYKVGTKLVYLDYATNKHSIVTFSNIGVFESRVYSATQFLTHKAVLTNGRIVTASSSGNLYILDTNGSILYTRNLTTDAVGSTEYTPRYNYITELTDGRFVVHYNRDTGPTDYILDWYFIIYDSNGNILFKSTSYANLTIAASSYSGYLLKVVPLSGGNFLTLLSTSTSQTNYMSGSTVYLIHNSSGGSVRARTTLLSNNTPGINIIQLTGGNIVFAGYHYTAADASTSQYRMGIISSTGTAVRSYSAYNTLYANDVTSLYTLPSGNFGLGHYNEYGEFTPTGTFVKIETLSKSFPLPEDATLVGSYLFKISRNSITNSYWLYSFDLYVIAFGTYYEYNISLPSETKTPSKLMLLANGEAEEIVSETISNDTITCTYKPKIKTGRDMQIKIVLDRDCEMESVNYVMSKALP